MGTLQNLGLAAVALLTASGASADEQPGNSFEAALLEEHNSARAELGIPALHWSRELEREAADWAADLARNGVLQHADVQRRHGAGENLWAGSSGYYDAHEMVGLFVEERRNYRHRAFPDVSISGNWADVGHYTQIVWRDTQQVGCALARGDREEFLVCRYWPAGNYMGQFAF